MTVTYEKLNDILAELLFPILPSPQPVYVELDEYKLAELANRLESTEEEARSAIVEAVRSKVLQSPSANPLKFALDSIAKWDEGLNPDKKVVNEPFPQIPLLVVLILAGLEMGMEGGFNTHAYYPRLQNILGVSTPEDLAHSYRGMSQHIWGNFNNWLDVVENERRGIGTVRAIGTHEHIGYILSQSLIRSADRKKLPNVFKKYGFGSFESATTHDMLIVLDHWINNAESHFGEISPTRPLQNLWYSEEARERICEIACSELSNWNGSVPKIKKADGTYLELSYQLAVEVMKSGFPTRLNISFAFFGPESESEMILNILDKDSNLHPISLTGDSTGWHYPTRFDLPISGQDLLQRKLSVKLDEDSQEISRTPLKILILKLDDVSRRFREVERVELGARSMIFVQDFGKYVQTCRDLLASCARVGWKEHTTESLAGIPAGWHLFEDVELLQVPDPALLKLVAFEVFKPVRPVSLSFTGGLQLPGNNQKMLNGAPFEIRANVPGSNKILIEIYEQDLASREKVYECNSQSSSLIHKIEPYEIPDGTYQVEVKVDGTEEPLVTKTLRIVSSDTTDFMSWRSSEKIIYNCGQSARGALIGSSFEDDFSLVVDGPLVVSIDDILISEVQKQAANKPNWGYDKSLPDSNSAQVIELSDTENQECFKRGAHTIQIPQASPNKRRNGHQIPEGGRAEAKCEFCGYKTIELVDPYLAKRLFERRIAAADKETKLELPSNLDVSKISAVIDLEHDWDLAFDALMHIGGGKESSISAIAANLKPGALFKRTFINTLEALGHIDISRDEKFEVIDWEINPTFLVQGRFSYFLVGYWPKTYTEKLQEHFGKKYVEEKGEDALTKKSLISATSIEVEEFIANSDFEINLVNNSSATLLESLPSINEIALALSSTKYGILEDVAIYNPLGNEWKSVTDISKPGGFRIKSAFRTRYCVTTKSDIDQRTVRYCSPEFAKHYQSIIQSGAPLIAFDKDSENLLVPIGAELPGLFGRAAVMEAGELMHNDSLKRYSMYPKISQDFANRLFERMAK